jgi:hypothetical protein
MNQQPTSDSALHPSKRPRRIKPTKRRWHCTDRHRCSRVHRNTVARSGLGTIYSSRDQHHFVGLGHPHTWWSSARYGRNPRWRWRRIGSCRARIYHTERKTPDCSPGDGSGPLMCVVH